MLTKSHKITLAILSAVLAIQLIPSSSTPEIKNGIPVKWDSSETKQLFDRACADCHSNTTNYPWYSKVAPISWLINEDINEGREHFNVDTVGMQSKNKLTDAAEEVEEGKMPMKIYVMMHKKADLTSEEQDKLVNGLKNTFGQEKE